jgi:hypothetical protein
MFQLYKSSGSWSFCRLVGSGVVMWWWVGQMSPHWVHRSRVSWDVSSRDMSTDEVWGTSSLQTYRVKCHLHLFPPNLSCQVPPPSVPPEPRLASIFLLHLLNWASQLPPVADTVRTYPTPTCYLIWTSFQHLNSAASILNHISAFYLSSTLHLHWLQITL